MNFEKTLKALSQCQPDHGFREALVEIGAPINFSKPEGLEDFLADWAGAEGWIARQSAVDIYSTNGTRPKNGHVVTGELTIADKSIQIRRLPDRWIVSTVYENRGMSCLCDEVRHLTLKHGAAKLGAAVYRRFWKLPEENPEDGAIQVFAWRFVRFEELSS